MQVILTGKVTDKSQLAALQVNWLVRELKLKSARTTLEIIPKSNLRKTNNCRGLAGMEGDVIGMAFDSSLRIEEILRVVSHEMIHVKQLAKGQLKYKIEGKKESAFWLGKNFELKGTNYVDRPWEFEAYSKQEVLSLKFDDFLGDLKRMKKNDRIRTVREISGII